MRYSLTCMEQHFRTLTDHLFSGTGHEKAAYLLCGLSRTVAETRLLVREVVPVDEGDVLASSATGMKISSHSYLRTIKKAHLTNASFVFVHTHPPNVPKHSVQDDREEAALFATAYSRIHKPGCHASLVLSSPDRPVGRVWLQDGSFHGIDVVRILGNRFRFYFGDDGPLPDFAIFDRQIRAFGKDLQILLRRLVIGVVGAGGTGSSVSEQLIRLGAGHLVIADPQKLADSNVTRVYGSGISDAGKAKVALVAELAGRIGLGTQVDTIERSVTVESAIKEFRKCDVIFACTDDHWGRSLLNRLSIYYCIPVFDLGVKIDSEHGVLQSAQGRVTTLMPGCACLFCRKRISAERIRLESMSPEEAAALRKDGYAPELPDPDPAVIPFTTAVSATAVADLLHRLTGFRGEDLNSTEVIHLFDANKIGKNHTTADADCFCSDRSKWARGDSRLFLDTTWRPE
jgi:hypothetical protein